MSKNTSDSLRPDFFFDTTRMMQAEQRICYRIGRHPRRHFSLSLASPDRRQLAVGVLSQISRSEKRTLRVIEEVSASFYDLKRESFIRRR